MTEPGNIMRTAAFALALLAPAGAAASSETLTFDVFLDNKAIGEHRFVFERADEQKRVRSEADFEVRFLLIKAFDYEHRNTEVWRRGCLQSIDARTSTNGRVSEVSGSADVDGFRVQAPGATQAIDECVATFAYWDRELLNRDRLLNAQTGEYLAVERKDLGRGTLQLSGEAVPVERLRLSAKDLDIIVSYDLDTGEWLGLESTLEKGRTLRYLRDSARPARLAEFAVSTSAQSEETL